MTFQRNLRYRSRNTNFYTKGESCLISCSGRRMIAAAAPVVPRGWLEHSLNSNVDHTDHVLTPRSNIRAANVCSVAVFSDS